MSWALIGDFGFPAKEAFVPRTDAAFVVLRGYELLFLGRTPLLRVLRGYVCLGRLPLCTWTVFYVAK